MESAERIDERPQWAGLVDGLIFDAEISDIPRNRVVMTMGKICAESLLAGTLEHYGEMQRYLRDRNAFIQLVAQPVDALELSRAGICCIDIRTHEPRGHSLIVSIGTGKAERELERLGISPETNEALLQHDTGMFATI